jgi:DnaJ-class molecular chaperone
MTEPHKEPCPVCAGKGTVPHTRHRMANGEADPTDFKTVDVCEKCGGGGKVPVNMKAIQERLPGFIVDSL